MDKESDMQQQIEQLQETNSQLLEQVDDLNRKLVESESFKSHFLSNITNEIVNPFASVMGLSQQIMELKKEDFKKAAGLARLIFSEATALDFQLRNIFMAARLEAGEEKPEPAEINLRQMLEAVVDKIKHEADKKGIRISLEIAPYLERFVSDSEKLELILMNLLSNAVKFSEFGKDITVRAHKTENRDVEVEVADKGIGMTKDEINRIFDRFHRANPVIQSITPGSGLGLAVVEGLLFVLNGKAEINSHPGKGTLVRIFLPEETRENIEFDDALFFDDETEESF